jgi:ribose transport system substrate-binding protein
MAFKQVAKTAMIALGMAAAASATALAQQGLDEPFQKQFNEALVGKTSRVSRRSLSPMG